MSVISPQPILDLQREYQGEVSWRSPSNIALVKYWGKRPVQLPANASISFTLSEAHTETTVIYSSRDRARPWVDFSFEGRKVDSFATRILKYFDSLLEIMPWLDQLSFDIESNNSFPHSSGIASSASSMSALALCLCDIEQSLFNLKKDTHLFRQKASYISRLGSGSAARSVYPGIALWGASDHMWDSSDDHAIPVTGVSDVFTTFHDDVLIVSADKKSVSSSAGHALMDTNLFAEKRYEQAHNNLGALLLAMKSGDLTTFGKIVEDEALTLHALMMCSDPSFILMKPGTLEVIDRIRTFRQKTSLPIYFTLDAGPNVHILYPDHISKEALAFINSDLAPLASDKRIIKDFVGPGPTKLL